MTPNTPIPTPREVFLAALKLAPNEWPAYLDRVCGGESELRARVQDLLDAHIAAGSFLQSHADAAFAPTITERSPLESPGTVIGPYKLLEQIGEGGFGVVFMAEQTTPVKRKVALKVIKPGMDTQQVIARFEAERQALALMDHPNIARVFDAGATETGRPYFVMELVKGMPITSYCDQHQLAPNDRLELFVTVCQAVQHAHQKGIIHRDIKPSNVLVTLHDDRPVVKVIDFGIAKATIGQLTDKTLFTGLAQLIGTPLYMSPEQASLSAIDVDTRSDVYSLGVLLYELLTGTTPFDKSRLQQAAFDEVRRIIREEEPQKPSTRLSSLGETLPSVSALRSSEPRKLSQLVRGDLDWIVMRALEKDRSRRYDTANGFAADVLRYLANEPVTACPPSAGYRFRKFARRNRAVLLTVAVVASALLLGVVGTTWQAYHALEQRDRAVAAEQEAETQRTLAQQRADEAEESSRKARQAVDDMYTQVAEKWLVNQPNLEPLQREFLEKTLRFYEELARAQGTDPAIRLETARANRRVGEVRHRLGQRAESEQAFNQAIERLQTLADEFPAAPSYRYELAAALHKLGMNIGDTRSHTEEETLHRRALALEEQLAAEFPDSSEYRLSLGLGYCSLARALSRTSGTGGEHLIRSALAVQKKLLDEFPDVAEHRRNLADSYLVLGEYLQRSQPQDAHEARLSAATLLEGLVTDGTPVPDDRNRLANVYYWIAAWCSDDAAEQWLLKALALQEGLATDFPAVTDYRYDLLRSLDTLSAVSLSDARPADAERVLRRAVGIGERLIADSPKTLYYHSRLAVARRHLADFLASNGQPAEAEVLYREAIGVFEALRAKSQEITFRPHEVTPCYAGLARLLRAAGRDAEAGEVDQRLAVLNQTKWERELAELSLVVERFPGSPNALAARAHWLQNHGRFTESNTDYVRLLELLPSEHWFWYHRACLLAYLNREQEYQEHCRVMVARFTDAADVVVIERTTKGALLLPVFGGDAEALAQQAARAVQLAPESPWSTLLQGMAEYRAGRFNQAVEWLEKCRTAPCEDYGGRARTVAANAYTALARQQMGQGQEAQELLGLASRQAAHDLASFDSGELNHGGVENWLVAHIALREATSFVAGQQVAVLQHVVGASVPPLPALPSAASPFGGTAVTIPGVVQAEDFDEGGEGLAYHDTTYQDGGAQASLPRYRVESVDIDDCADNGGGFNIGGILAGEWLSYTVQVAEDGVYDLDVRYCSPSGGRLHAQLGGTDVSGPIELAATGWGHWTTVTATGVRLSAGRQALRIVFDSAGTNPHVCNLNWIELRPTASREPSSDSDIENPARHAVSEPTSGRQN